jgi:threonine aldolase
MSKVIDLRSDTVTKPTEDMRLAIYRAEVGDDVYQDDPTVNHLEKLAAEMLGKEAALFVSSGTQGNIVSLLTHTKRGDEVILEKNAHIFLYEVAGMAALGGLMANRIQGNRGFMSPEDVEAVIRTKNVHYPDTTVLCVENTHNYAGGAVISLQQQLKLREVADKYNLKMHLDGARFFNAMTALNCDPKELAEPYDSIQICLSKGLGAPVGSLILGSKDFIEKARRYRKMLGGGMRQAGIIAAGGIFALENNIARLKEDHDNAKYLASEISSIDGLKLVYDQIDTNIIYFNIETEKINAVEFCNKLKENDILANPSGEKKVRFVTHLGVNKTDCEKTIETIKNVMIL